MILFKKKCQYCGKKIEKGEEVLARVKIPEFIDSKVRAFCSEEHVKLYKKNITKTPSKSSCPYCRK